MSTPEIPPEHGHNSTHSAIAIPDQLDSTSSKLVYLYLSTVGDATIDDLQTALDLPQLTLFPVLQTLERADLVECDGLTYTITA